MGTDRNDDEPATEINVDVDPSEDSEISVAITREARIMVSGAGASPADSEPHTLEPQTLEPVMSVRGLGPVTATSDDDDDDDEEEATTRTSSVERRLLAASASEQRARRGSSAGIGPIITPSEPFRLSSTSESKQLAKTLSSASVVVAAKARSRSNESDPDPSEATVERPPMTKLSQVSEPEEETATDSLRMFAPASVIVEPEPPEEDDTKTTKDLAGVAAAVAHAIGSVPRPRGGDASLHEPLDDGGSAIGSTMKIPFPKNVSTLVYAATVPVALPVQPMPVAMPEPAYAAVSPLAPTLPPNHALELRLLQPPPPPPPPTTRRIRTRKRSGVRWMVAIFLLTAVGTAAGVLYVRRRPTWPPWLAKHEPIPTAPAASLSAEALAQPSATASALPSASASASASALPSASASAAPSASASGRGRGRKPPKK